MKYELSIDTLGKLDGGRLVVALQQELDRAMADINDRPADDANRVVTLQIVAKPLINDAGELDEVAVKFLVPPAKLPKRQSKWIRTEPRKVRDATTGKTRHQLVFNDLSEDDPRQGTLDESDPEAWQGE